MKYLYGFSVDFLKNQNSSLSFDWIYDNFHGRS